MTKNPNQLECNILKLNKPVLIFRRRQEMEEFAAEPLHCHLQVKVIDGDDSVHFACVGKCDGDTECSGEMPFDSSYFKCFCPGVDAHCRGILRRREETLEMDCEGECEREDKECMIVGWRAEEEHATYYWCFCKGRE